MDSLHHLGILASFSHGDSQGFSQHGASVHVVNSVTTDRFVCLSVVVRTANWLSGLEHTL